MKLKTKNLTKQQFIAALVMLEFHKVEAGAIADYLALHPDLPSGQRGITYVMNNKGKYSIQG